MSQLTLSLLGPPHIARDGMPLQVDTRKAIALLAYLAVTGAPQRRDTLATLLWPDSDQPGARAALRRTLSALNRALAGEWLSVERETVGLRRDPALRFDVAQFREGLARCRRHGHAAAEVCPACLPLLADAAALYRDDFLAGFTLRDSPAFDDWQLAQAEELRRDLAGALERLVAGCSAQGEFAAALAHARRWLALDPLHESAHRWLMRVYAWAGQRAAALQQYRACVRVLDRELGVAPLEETTRLYHAIKGDHAPPPPAALVPHPRAREPGEERALPTRDASGTPTAGPADVPAAGLPPYPLVGRAAEWAALGRAYAAAGPDGRVVVLEGEAGIGKTRLAEEFLADARSGGAATLAMRCFEGEASLAYGPFVVALREVIAQPGRVVRGGGRGRDFVQRGGCVHRVRGTRLCPRSA